MTLEYKNLTATLSCDKFRDKIWDYQRTMTALLRSTENDHDVFCVYKAERSYPTISLGYIKCHEFRWNVLQLRLSHAAKRS